MTRARCSAWYRGTRSSTVPWNSARGPSRLGTESPGATVSHDSGLYAQGRSAQTLARQLAIIDVEVEIMRTRLTWRDGVAAVFAVLIGLVTLAVVDSWRWPLLGSHKAGSVALLVLAIPMCAVGGNAFWDSVAFEHPIQAFRDPFLAIAMVLAPVAIVVVVGALVTGTEGWFLALAAIIGLKWLVATTRHAVETVPRIGSQHLVFEH
jgi:hypothetical protein